MAKIINEGTVQYEKKNVPVAEYGWHTTKNLGALLGTKKVHMDIRSLDPNAYSYPYHFHHNAEEVFVVLSGEMTLRTPEGLSVLRQGDVVFCETGATGAHQMYNHTQADCRYLDIVTAADMDMAEYPDTGKVLVMTSGEMYLKGAEKDYFDGEEKPADIWKRLMPVE